MNKHITLAKPVLVNLWFIIIETMVTNKYYGVTMDTHGKNRIFVI